jgi:signal transduction histidine kinase
MHEADENGCADDPMPGPAQAGRVRPLPKATNTLPGRRWGRAAAPTADELCLRAPQPDHVLAAQEQERRRIAVDLHDGLGPLLTLIRLELAQAAELAGPGHPGQSELGPVIDRAASHVARAFDELRRTVANLRPAMLDDLGIVPTIRWLVREFEQSRAGVLIRVDLAVSESEVPAALKIVIFRICQEALNNIVKHAEARCAMLSLTRSGNALQLWIEDDGRGLAVAQADLSRRAGGGLAGIHWRASGSGGRCEIGSLPGRGTWIRVSWQVSQPGGADVTRR